MPSEKENVCLCVEKDNQDDNSNSTASNPYPQNATVTMNPSRKPVPNMTERFLQASQARKHSSIPEKTLPRVPRFERYRYQPSILPEKKPQSTTSGQRELGSQPKQTYRHKYRSPDSCTNLYLSDKIQNDSKNQFNEVRHSMVPREYLVDKIFNAKNSNDWDAFGSHFSPKKDHSSTCYRPSTTPDYHYHQNPVLYSPKAASVDYRVANTENIWNCGIDGNNRDCGLEQFSSDVISMDSINGVEMDFDFSISSSRPMSSRLFMPHRLY
jgi:hypothetical protein